MGNSLSKNKPVRIYSPALNFKGVVEDHRELIWHRKYSEPGTFEIHAPITDDNLKYLEPGNIVTYRGAGEAAVIEDIINEESSNITEIVREGRFLSCYFDYRRIGTPANPTVYFKGSVEEAMRFLIRACSPIPGLEIAPACGYPEQVEFQATMKNLCTYLTKLSLSSGIGYRIRPDFKRKKLIFETYKGVNRTLSQGVNSRVIFSEAYENLNEVQYSWNNQLLITELVVGGEGEGKDRKYITLGGGTGLGLRQGFCDAKDARSEGLTPAQYTEVLRQKGLEYLATHAINESLIFQTDPHVNFNYREHYDLGDIATAEKRKWKKKIDQRMSELKEIHRNGGMTVEPTMGDPLPETMDWSDE